MKLVFDKYNVHDYITRTLCSIIHYGFPFGCKFFPPGMELVLA